MRQLLKPLINGLLQPTGHEVRAIHDRFESNPYWVQQQLIKSERPVIFDVGAHEGEITAKYRNLFPQATIHAFEPFPEAVKGMEARFRGDPTVTCNAVAVGDAEGTIELNVNASSATNSILKSSPEGPTHWGNHLMETQRATTSVPMVTLDAYCLRHGIESIDLLKLDIQGAELRALQGARSLLEGRRIGLVYMELMLASTYIGQPLMADYLQFFEGVGYTLFNLFEPVRKNLRLLQMDVIWVPQDRSKNLPQRESQKITPAAAP